MNIWELFRSAFLSLRAHKIRVLLTMIGIVVGISAVVAILSLGAGLKNQVNQSSDSSKVNVTRVVFEPEVISLNTPTIDAFTYEDLKILESIEGVEKVNQGSELFSDFLGSVKQAEFFQNKSLLSLETDINGKQDLIFGRTLSKEDEIFKNQVIVLSNVHAIELFGARNLENAVGKGIRLNNEYFEVVGIQAKESKAILGETDQIPKFAKKMLFDDESITAIDVKVAKEFDSKKVLNNVKEELKRIHSDLNGEYLEENPDDMIKNFQQIISGVTGFIAFVTGISLFVGGIGVMNIMYVSVSERKREIGIRRAIGAKKRTILFQFLIEAIIITAIGGIIGIILGYGASSLISMFIPFKPVLTPTILIGSSMTSVTVGIIFGIIPAIKAANLKPIKAIYH